MLRLNNLDINDFLTNYWQKKPLRVEGVLPDFNWPITANELAGLSLEPEIESRLVIQSPKDNSWQLEQGPFQEQRFANLPPSHWTLLVQAVNHWVPEFTPLLELFRFIPDWRLDDIMISYAAEGGGVGPHYDYYDVFLIQISGIRRWEFGGLYGDHSACRTDVPVRLLTDWQPEETWDFAAGDMLYLPPGVGHNGYAITDDCMTCSIGFRAPAHQDILTGYTDWLADKTKLEQRYTDSDLKLQQNPAEITAESLERVKSILHQYIEQPDSLAQWFGQYITEPKYPELADSLIATDITELELSQPLNLERNPSSRFAFNQINGQMHLFVDGQSFDCTPEQQPLVQQLCANNHNLFNSQNQQQQKLVQQLLKMGALYIIN